MPKYTCHPVAAASGLTVALLLAGCTPTPASTHTPTSAPHGSFDHIHALAPSSDGLMVATHTGIYTLDFGAGSAATATGPVGGLDFDPMGYTIADGTAYASGHPGPTTPAELEGPNMGLIRSDDGGLSWSTVSLGGETDFHALSIGPSADARSDVIYGLDSATGSVRHSTDEGLSWSDGASLEARTILADPATPGVIYATTGAGFAVSSDYGVTFSVDNAAPPLFLVAAAPLDALVGVDITGTVWARDGGGWKEGGTVTGTPQAMLQDGTRLYVADDRGIAYTEDLGKTWAPLVIAS